ncbi:hypothetical protein D5085_06285 [Ectothiorhodospiraceae bacterium BW-2]|nr:hypothetical protein D5085_06285 [Ectothiorhodospiraceae bacterium BW-2]
MGLLRTAIDIHKGEPFYISPAGNSAEKFALKLIELYPELSFLGFIDSFKSNFESGGNIYRVDQVKPENKSNNVIIVIEKNMIRKKIMDTLKKNGFSNLSWIECNFVFEPKANDDNHKDILCFFYDLNVNTLTFEFVNALVHAEAERRKRELKWLHTVIVPKSPDSVFDFSRESILRNNKNALIESDNQWFLYNVIVPSVTLVPSNQGISICSLRDEARILAEHYSGRVFPENYSVDNPMELDSSYRVTDTRYNGSSYGLPLKSGKTAISFVKQWCNARAIDLNKVVSITMREYTLEKDRNSDISAWKCFANRVKSRGLIPVFVKDTYADFNMDDLGDYYVFHVAAWNIMIRMAFYECVYFNMAVNTGPAILSSFNPNVKYLNFIYVSEDDYAGSSIYFEGLGHEIGGQYPDRTPFQFSVWGGSRDCNKIFDAFEAMCELIDNDG